MDMMGDTDGRLTDQPPMADGSVCAGPNGLGPQDCADNSECEMWTSCSQNHCMDLDSESSCTSASCSWETDEDPNGACMPQNSPRISCPTTRSTQTDESTCTIVAGCKMTCASNSCSPGCVWTALMDQMIASTDLMKEHEEQCADKSEAACSKNNSTSAVAPRNSVLRNSVVVVVVLSAATMWS